MLKINFIYKSVIVAIIFMAVFSFVNIAQAATASLSFYPSSINANVGDTINVSVLVNTDSVTINNTEAVIDFPSDILQVISVPTSNSIFSMWIENPNFSNSAGTISFNGGVPNPGFTGAGGKIMGITFKAKKSGTASLSFTSGSILANDGLGTDVTGNLGKATFSIADALPNNNPTSISTTKSLTTKLADSTKALSKNIQNTATNVEKDISEKVNYVVQQPLQYVDMSQMTNIITIIVAIFILIILIIILLFYIWRKFYLLVNKVEKQIHQIEYSSVVNENEFLKIKDNVYTKLDERTNYFEKALNQIRADNTKIEKNNVSLEKAVEQIRLNNSGNKKELAVLLDKVKVNIKEKIDSISVEFKKLRKSDENREQSISSFKLKSENQINYLTENVKESIHKLEMRDSAIEKDLLITRMNTESKNDLLEKDLSQIRENSNLKDEKIDRKINDFNILLIENIKKLKQSNDENKNEILKIKNDVYARLEEKLNSFTALSQKGLQDVSGIVSQYETIIKTNMDERDKKNDGEMMLLKSDINKKIQEIATLKLDVDKKNQENVQQITSFKTNVEKKMEERLNNLTVALNSDMQKLKDDNAIKDAEKEKEFINIRENIASILKKEFSSLHNMNSASEKELLKVKENIQAQLNDKVAGLKKELQQLKKEDVVKAELAKLEAKKEELIKLQEELGARMKSDFDSKAKLFDKKISQFNETNASKEKEIAKIESKMEAKIDAKISSKVDNTLKDKISAVEKEILQIKKADSSGKEKLSKIEDNIKKIDNYYKKLDSEEQDMRQKLERMNSSLKAFYSSTILSLGEPTKKRR